MASWPDYLIAPADVGTTTATVWVGSLLDTPPDPAGEWIEHPPSGSRWPLALWRRWVAPDQAAVLRHQRIALTGLQPATRYPLELRVGNEVRARADVSTLPDALPPLGQPPFIVLLGSCFSRLQDEGGEVGRAFAQLPGGARPHVKFLMGDQVYLDSPWYRFALPQSSAGLARGFLEHYAGTWGQRSDAQGFAHLLSAGANYFCSDDHEFWNNAPFPSSFAVNTWTPGGRDTWFTHARQLYEAFQTTGSSAAFNVGQLNILVLDTRIDRQADRSNFVRPETLAMLEQWVANLTSPGVIVIGQPIFAGKVGFRGRFTDWNLPDFEQYASLCQVLLSSRQSILLMTGDVHYGRIATALLPSGAELIELIASPMSLVDRAAGGRWHAAPGRFPSDPIPGIASVPVATDATWQRFANHFVTIEFNELGGGVNVRVKAWEIAQARMNPSPGGPVTSATVAERFLKRLP